jgi:hypothetical protein
MPGLIHHTVARTAQHVPGLRRMPVLKLLALGEVLMLLRDHFGKLDPVERRRVIALVRRGRGRSSKLTDAERDELAALIAKAEPRLLFGATADKLSPVPLPKRVLFGARGARR